MPAKEGPRSTPAPAPRAHRVPPPRTASRVPPHALASLQRSAGNAAVTLAVQRLAGAPASPKQDPRFRAVEAQVKQQGKKLAAHPPAKAEAKKAQDAAVAPPDDREAKAKAGHADEMAAAKPGGFDKAAFIAAVKKAIAAQAPKNLDEADKLATSGKADTVKAEVAGKVTEGKQASAKDITDKTAKPPDPSGIPAKPVTPLAPPQPAAPAPLDAAKAMPARAPPAATDLSAPKAETDARMAEAGVTEEQLAKSNEPEFTGALAAKKEGEQHSATAPAAVRAAEAQTLAGAQVAAKTSGGAGLAAMARGRNSKLGQVATGKSGTKARDEQKRAEFTTFVKGVFDRTKTEVQAILGALDGEVARRFDEGERAARAAFTADHKARFQAYKDARYDGVTGAARWAADLFTGLPREVDQIYVQARQLYESRMERVISDVADHIGAELTRAKNRIAAGQAEIKKYVASQPKDLQKIAQEAADGFEAQFAQLEADVDSKQDALVDDLASRYVEASNAVNDEINAAKEANKGLWDKAKEAVGGAIDTIIKLKDMLLGVLARAAGAIEKIIKDPIGFLGNFVNAVKAGISGFAANIGEHLKKGLQAWLFGALAEAGIEIPETFDLKGIVKLILSILGLTWANIRARIVKALPGGEKVMGLLEKAVDFIQIILSEGVGGLWKWVAAKISDLKEMVLGKIKEFVITRIITAGITWLISMLNPAAAFIKACKMIYDVVMFFVEKAAQIKEFVDSVLDSVESIAGGGVGAVAGLIEKTLARMLPVLIGFLASLLGLGGISEKVKSILTAIQKPVMGVVDKLIAGAVKIGKKLLAKLTGKGKEDKRSPEEKQAALDAAMTEAQGVLQNDDTTIEDVEKRLPTIQSKHKVRELRLVKEGESGGEVKVHVFGANSPGKNGPTVPKGKKATVSAKGTMKTVKPPLRRSQFDPAAPPEGVAVLTQTDRNELGTRWLALAAKNPARAQYYRENAERARRGQQPKDGDASEIEVRWLHGLEHDSRKKSHRVPEDRVVVPDEKKPRSNSIPDFEIGSWSFETKRYTIYATGERNKLISDLRNQYQDRLAGLPPHAQVQAIVVDLRGQYLKPADVATLRQEIYDEVVLVAYARAKAAGAWYLSPNARPPGIDSVTMIVGDVG